MNTNNNITDQHNQRHHRQQHHQRNNNNNDNNNNSLPSLPAMAAAQAALAHVHHQHHHVASDGDILAATPPSPTENALNDLRMSHSDIIANRSSNNNSPPPRFHDSDYHDYPNHHLDDDNNNNNDPPAAAAPQFWQRVIPPPPVALRGLLMLPINGSGDTNNNRTTNIHQSEAATMKKRTLKNKKTADGSAHKSSTAAVAAGAYPLPAYCNFVPGGIGYNHASLKIPTAKEVGTASAAAAAATGCGNANQINLNEEEEDEGIVVHLSRYCDSGITFNSISSSAAATAAATSSPKVSRSGGIGGSGIASPKNNATTARSKVDATYPHASSTSGMRRPEIIIRRALLADMTLRKYALHSLHQHVEKEKLNSHNLINDNNNNNNKVTPPSTTTTTTTTTTLKLGHRLPSLSHLAHSALVNPLTAVSANHAVLWAEAMILEYMDGRLEEQLMIAPTAFASSSLSSTLSEHHHVLNLDKRLSQMKMEFETQMNRDFLLSSSSSPTFALEEEEKDAADYSNQEKKKKADPSSPSAQRLLQRAIVSAWAQEEAMTGRTPTNISSSIHVDTNNRTNHSSKVTKENALVMELPTLKGLLQACWRVQRGEEEENEDNGENNAMKHTSTSATRSSSASLSSSCCSTTAAALSNSKSNSFVGSPCGYVFRRGDIAWNCRTCQTDATCVLCDNCFRESDHVGHEVLFHRTTPGGCCDCGDLEAWNVKGMCPRHRPPPPQADEEEDEEEEDEDEKVDEAHEDADYAQERSAGKRRKKKDGEISFPSMGGGGGGGGSVDDDFEAVRAAQRSRLDHERHVDGIPSKSVTIGNATPRPLPPRLAAALATVIASTIQSILVGVEGSAIGADVSQWRLRWADEICKIWNGVSEDEEYYRRGAVLWEQLIDEKRRAKMRNDTTEKSSSSNMDEEITKEMEMEKDRLWAHPRHVLDSHHEHYASELPPNYNLLLRLHNDDVHTFDEVINALHSKSGEPIQVPVGGKGSVGEVGGAGITGEELKALGSAETWTKESNDSIQQQRRVFRTYSSSNSSSGGSHGRGSSLSPASNRSPASNNIGVPQNMFVDDSEDATLSPSGMMQFVSEIDPSAPLIPRMDEATDLTRKVDADGQVSVRAFETLNDAGIGFSRLRESAGLHCAVLTSARIESEERAKTLLEWLGSLIGSHPAVSALIVQCLVDVTEGEDVLCSEKNKTVSIPGKCRGVVGWLTPKMMPCWSGTSRTWSGEPSSNALVPAWRRRIDAFPPYLESSYLTREEGRELFRLGILSEDSSSFIHATGADPNFYANVPYNLPDDRLRKSPHALWGILPSSHVQSDGNCDRPFTHPLLQKFSAALIGSTHDDTLVNLRPKVFVIDTDLRKHEEGEHLTAALFPHSLAGLNLISGVGYVDRHGSVEEYFGNHSNGGVDTVEHSRQVVSCSSFVAPASPLLLLLLMDPYSPKHLRSYLHRLFLSLLTDSRFKSRFAASLGAVVYRPTTTLFCAGIGTEADTLLSFTVQLFTTGSLVRALGNLDATKALLSREDTAANESEMSCISALPIAHSVVRSVHSNIMGATKEVSIAFQKALVQSDMLARDLMNTVCFQAPPALVYQYGLEHPLTSRLPCAPDDKFIDSRCMKHKRLPHLLRDLEYIYETPGTAGKLLRLGRASSTTINTPLPSPTAGVQSMTDFVTSSPSFTVQSAPIYNNLATYSSNALEFPTVWVRLLRLGQGIDLQKRRISGGHVEFEDERWLSAYGLSLNLSSTGDALSESLFYGINSADKVPLSTNSSSIRVANREAIGGLFAAYFREIKMWLYREGLLEADTSLPATRETGELEALQRSTLHVSRSQLDESTVNKVLAATGVSVAQSCDVACERGVKNLPEAKLALLEAALLHERTKLSASSMQFGIASSHGPVMGDWLKVPHSPLAGDGFSFHLPLHRALARSILCYCSAVVPIDEQKESPDTWWRLPVLDDDDDFATDSSSDASFKQDTLSALIRITHKSSNFRVVWSSGPDCSSPEAQLRKSRSRMMSALLASTKVIHSLCDHPLRCIAASQQIDHHMWAKNGASTAGMSLNYGSVPLCRSLRDLDVVMVQLSAAGFNVGLGARRVFSLLVNRFSLDGYLCDPDRRPSIGQVGWSWTKPPRMQEPEHAEMLAESFFTTVCVIVSDLPAPPPKSVSDISALRQNLRRELLHALSVEPRSHSEAMSAASAAGSRRDEYDSGAGGASFRAVFTEVLHSIGQQRNQGSRATSGPPTFELKPEGSHEYDPCFYHLRKTEHQHAMDNIARLRSQKLGASSDRPAQTMVIPLVAKPPPAHPRFLPARLVLHVPSMYAAIRRYLMYVLFNGSWLPPSKPETDDTMSITIDGAGDVSVPHPGTDADYQRTASTMSSRSTTSRKLSNLSLSFSPETVAASSKSFLEVLHILTLQLHTLEECSKLHEILPSLDHEHKLLSSSISINSYLRQLVFVPNSLANVWALQSGLDGPLPSEGSGRNRGSVLGLLIALYEHRDNAKSTRVSQKSANDDHGGARVLSADGLKWLLRFISSLVDGAEDMAAAHNSASSGIPFEIKSSHSDAGIIDPKLRHEIKGMLDNLPELWPGREFQSSADSSGFSAAKKKNEEAQKAAKSRALMKMKKLQSSFAASISSQFDGDSQNKLVDDDEENLCIICRCDDADGDNGPMGYLGHVQRSRVVQLASKSTLGKITSADQYDLDKLYRVVGDKGCQLRSTESMESAPVAFLPRGSIVEVLQAKISPQLGLLSRRVLVRRVAHSSRKRTGEITQGWASIQSWQGYRILSPLSSLCYTNTRWGSTRPIIRQCGHAAHFQCVEAHCLSLHQRAAGNQPYDGRFSANIEDGEFLCPLCKQLSNILIPEDKPVNSNEVLHPQTLTHTTSASMREEKEGFEVMKNNLSSYPADVTIIRNILTRKLSISYAEPPSKHDVATLQFGSSLSQAMQLSSEKVGSFQLHPALRRWDFEDDDQGESTMFQSNPYVGSILRLMRRLFISWAAIGHGAEASEASGRNSRHEAFGEVTYTSIDPWSGYTANGRDSHPMLMELRRTITAAANLFDAVTLEMGRQLGPKHTKNKGETVVVLGNLISDILEGQHWVNSLKDTVNNDWRVVTSMIAAMPCHASRGDTIAPRLEARSVAAAMWTITGSLPPRSNDSVMTMLVDSSNDAESEDFSVGNHDVARISDDPVRNESEYSQPRPIMPPKPLSVYRVERNLGVQLGSDWGTLDPFNVEAISSNHIAFRPAVASAFLYVPLLAWDLTTLAGAVFSSLLSNSKSNPCVSHSELVQSAKVLLVGRLIQVLSTPGGFLTSTYVQDDFDDIDEGSAWDDDKKKKESTALKDLLVFCRKILPDAIEPGAHVIDEPSLLQNVSNAILPFGRTLILLLRASSSALSQRNRHCINISSADGSQADKVICQICEDPDIMTIENGFRLLEVIGAPLPSSIVNLDSNFCSWGSLVTRWLTALVGFDTYHGTRGNGLVNEGGTWNPVVHGAGSLGEGRLSCAPYEPFENVQVETSASAVEVAHLPPQREDCNSDDEDSDADFEEESDDISVSLSNEDEVMEIVDEALAVDADDDQDDALADFEIDMDVDFENPGNDDFGELYVDVDDASDVNAALQEPDGSKIPGPSDHMFAYVSRSAIIPYQPSILGINQLGPGPRGSHGELFEYNVANSVMRDLSHLGAIHLPGKPPSCLITLPSSFVELYSIVNRVKGRDSRSDDADDDGSAETAICLLTGTVMRSGTIRRLKENRSPGTCTLHARKVGSGIGIFFLVQKCTVLLMHNNKAAYSPSLYVDEHGEEDVGLRRGRPLFFSDERYQALETLWRSHGIPREVSQIRSTSDRVIRDNWY